MEGWDVFEAQMGMGDVLQPSRHRLDNPGFGQGGGWVPPLLLLQRGLAEAFPAFCRLPVSFFFKAQNVMLICSCDRFPR